MNKKTIFTDIENQVQDFDQTPLEDTYQDRSKVFIEVATSRRSVRKFSDETIPEDIVQKCLDLALLAPNSSNLQPWEFIRIKSTALKEQIGEICFSQNAATTASELIVCIARTDTWRAHCEQMLTVTGQAGETPAAVKTYYKKIAPLVYSLGPLGILGFFKKVFYFSVGLFRLSPREMTSFSELKTWAIKSTALGCENLMLAFRAFGYDTCPMEGFDSRRLKKALNLSRHQHVVMIVGAGRRLPEGVYGPQIRFPREQFIKEM